MAVPPRPTAKPDAPAPHRARPGDLSVRVDGPAASLCAKVWVVETQTIGAVRDRV